MPSEKSMVEVVSLAEFARNQAATYYDQNDDAAIAFRHIANCIEQRDALLSDPGAVHINMLRGSIAKPSFEQFKHIYASEFALALDEAKAERTEVTALAGAFEAGYSQGHIDAYQIKQNLCYSRRDAYLASLTQETPNG